MKAKPVAVGRVLTSKNMREPTVVRSLRAKLLKVEAERDELLAALKECLTTDGLIPWDRYSEMKALAARAGGKA